MASFCCFQGAKHDGNPGGSIKPVLGLNTYCSPDIETVAAIKKPIIVIIADAFGMQFINNQLVADSFAESGYQVLMPDFFYPNPPADPVIFDYLGTISADSPSFLTKAWNLPLAIYHLLPFMVRNRQGVASPKVEKFFTALRAETPTSLKIGVAGYCWGGQHSFQLADGKYAKAEKPLVDAHYTAHPSNLTLPDDAKNIKVPTSVAIGSHDIVLDKSGQKTVKEEMGKSGVANEFIEYPNSDHGFSIRGNPLLPGGLETMKQTRDQAISWFDKYLK